MAERRRGEQFGPLTSVFARLAGVDVAKPAPEPGDQRPPARPSEPEGGDGGGDEEPSRFQALLQRVDEYQQHHAWLGLPVAVVKKFNDDQAGKLAALMAYYGFFSLFPLLLVLVTILGFVLSDNPELQRKVLDSVLARFPIIGDQIEKNVHSLRGSGLGLAVGIAGSLWGGMGVMQAGQHAMNEIWDVPIEDRPKFLASRIRAALMLLVLGVGVVATTLLAGMATAGGQRSLGVKVGVLAATTVVNVSLYLFAFRLLTVRQVRLGQLVLGAALAAVIAAVLQALGGYYLGHQVKGASQTYGFFALVIGLLSWMYLQSQVTLFTAEINVVRARRLWPRSLVQKRLTEADKATLRGLAQVEKRQAQEHIEVSFTSPEEAGDESGR